MKLSKIRIAYPHLFQPREFSGNWSFEVTLMIPKTDAATLARVKADMVAAKHRKFGANPPEGLKSPIIDGDAVKTEAFNGHWIIDARSRSDALGSNRPGVILPNLQEAKPDDIVSGDFANLDVNFYGYDTGGNRGVALGLNNVQLCMKGDLIGGGRQRPESVFEAIEIEGSPEASGGGDGFGFDAGPGETVAKANDDPDIPF